jgi:hypothetical protein
MNEIFICLEPGLAALAFYQFWPVPSMKLYKIVDIQDYPLSRSLVLARNAPFFAH